jgi:translation initiation factor 1A
LDNFKAGNRSFQSGGRDIIKYCLLNYSPAKPFARRYRLPRRDYNQDEEFDPNAPQPEYLRVRLPRKQQGEIFGIADQLLGASRIRIMCADGKSRMGRIPGKIKKRMWIREGDLLILKPWDFQDDKADILYRYTKTQSMYLSRKKMIPESINIF